MKNKHTIIDIILGDKLTRPPSPEPVSAYAPSNIALIKYWGKRNAELNLPITSSLSISLGDHGCHTQIKLSEDKSDHLVINTKTYTADDPVYQRTFEFITLLCPKRTHHLSLNSDMNIPMAAGLASSACGFAALVLALNQFYAWQLTPSHCSILARLGSGSACRSLFQGFVEWQCGIKTNGMDSYAMPLADTWPELQLGLLVISDKAKSISSREAMQQTVAHSPLYQAWPQQVAQDLAALKHALATKDFQQFGEIAEHNALSMHATMFATRPAICYWQADSINAMQTIWQARQQGLPLYFTMDAGPNLKLLFLKKDTEKITALFPDLKTIKLNSQKPGVMK